MITCVTYVFPRLAPDNRSHALDFRCVLYRVWHQITVFPLLVPNVCSPRLAPNACFPALGTSTWQQYFVPDAIFTPLTSGKYVLELVSYYMFSRAWHWSYDLALAWQCFSLFECFFNCILVWLVRHIICVWFDFPLNYSNFTTTSLYLKVLFVHGRRRIDKCPTTNRPKARCPRTRKPSMRKYKIPLQIALNYVMTTSQLTSRM